MISYRKEMNAEILSPVQTETSRASGPLHKQVLYQPKINLEQLASQLGLFTSSLLAILDPSSQPNSNLTRVQIDGPIMIGLTIQTD